MAMTNYGNGYKFQAIMKRRQGAKALIQSLKKDGTWGKAREYDRYGSETDEDVVLRLNKLNPNSQFRIAE